MENRGWARFAQAVKGGCGGGRGKQISHMPLEESGVGLHMVAAVDRLS